MGQERCYERLREVAQTPGLESCTVTRNELLALLAAASVAERLCRAGGSTYSVLDRVRMVTNSQACAGVARAADIFEYRSRVTDHVDPSAAPSESPGGDRGR